jgi:hypothetical protein
MGSRRDAIRKQTIKIEVGPDFDGCGLRGVTKLPRNIGVGKRAV